MELERFIQKREYLYHLTDSMNIEFIRKNKKIFSTKYLIENSTLDDKKKNNLLVSRRSSHIQVNLNGTQIQIRDQKPLMMKSLEKCLTDNWNPKDYIYHLEITNMLNIY